MRKILKGLYRKEEGQILIFTGIIMAVLMGFSAITIDVGMMAIEKSKLQNVADAAVLAGAQELPDTGKAKTAAEEYAKANGVELKPENIITPVNGDNKKLKVIAERKVSHTMARMIGIKETNVKAAAVAETILGNWAGESLPFLNMGFDYSKTDPTAWTKVGPGIKGTIQDFYTKGNGSDKYFEVKYADGITITKGFSNGEKGLDNSKLKDGLDSMLKPSDENVKVLYLFSLRSDVIQSGKFTVNNNKETISLSELNKLNNGDTVDPYQLVLIKCVFMGCDYNNKHNIELKYIGEVFDLGNNKPGNDLPDFPTEDISTTISKSKLIG